MPSSLTEARDYNIDISSLPEESITVNKLGATFSVVASQGAAYSVGNGRTDANQVFSDANAFMTTNVNSAISFIDTATE